MDENLHEESMDETNQDAIEEGMDEAMNDYSEECLCPCHDECPPCGEEPIIEEPPPAPPVKRKFKNFKVWMIVLSVYITIFWYIGYIAFWPMAFNDPEQTVEKYFEIVEKYDHKFRTSEDAQHYRNTMTELIESAEQEAGDMQQLASQSFNIVLGAFLAFLSATVTTIFQANSSRD